MTEVRWRWAISRQETTQPAEAEPVRIVDVEVTGDAVWVGILRHVEPDEARREALLTEARQVRADLDASIRELEARS